MVAEREGLPALAGLVDVRVRVDQVVGAAVLGEEGEHRAGALGSRGHVVLFQCGIVAPVHDRVEVQVEDRLLGGWPGLAPIIGCRRRRGTAAGGRGSAGRSSR